jgi:hypothetical protein
VTAINYPTPAVRSPITRYALIAAASVGLTLGLVLPLTSETSTPVRSVAASACPALDNATQGSPAAFRLGETVADAGKTCSAGPATVRPSHPGQRSVTAQDQPWSWWHMPPGRPHAR